MYLDDIDHSLLFPRKSLLSHLFGRSTERFTDTRSYILESCSVGFSFTVAQIIRCIDVLGIRVLYKIVIYI
jgi:hypothetical protein